LHKRTLEQWGLPKLRHRLEIATDVDECRAIGAATFLAIDREKAIFHHDFRILMDWMIGSAVVCLCILSLTFKLKKQISEKGDQPPPKNEK
jgi:hypothetical protein